MLHLQDAETRQPAAPASFRPDHYGHRRRRDDWITIDRTTALVLGALASAALAVIIAAGSALVEKVEATAMEVERTRAERIASFGELAKTIGIVETKVEELIAQANQLEVRLERNVNRDLDMRDRKVEDLQSKIDQLTGYGEQRRSRQPRRDLVK